MENNFVPEIYVGENGNWFVNGYDTGTKAQGPKGDKGDKGDPGPVNIADNLETTAEGYALDARQGKVLDEKISDINENFNLKETKLLDDLHVQQQGKLVVVDLNFGYTVSNVWQTVASSLPKPKHHVPFIIAGFNGARFGRGVVTKEGNLQVVFEGASSTYTLVTGQVTYFVE